MDGKYNPALAALFADLCDEFNACDKAKQILSDLLESRDLGKQDNALIHFALGRLHDRSGLYDDAFHHISKANKLKADRSAHEAELRRIRAIIEVYDGNFMSTAPRSPKSSRCPVFIVGMPRSGTSLVEQIVSAHSQAFGMGELLYINQFAASMGDLTGTGKPYPYSVRDISSDQLGALASRYLEKTREKAGDARRIIDKMPYNFLNLGLIELLFPDARVIHCTRDPRDTCLSCYFQDFGELHAYSYDPGFLAEYYTLYQQIMQHWESVLSIPILKVRYEELVANQEDISRAMIEFCGLEWEENCLDYASSTREIATASYSQARQPLYRTSIGKWRNYEKHLAPLFDALQEGRKRK